MFRRFSGVLLVLVLVASAVHAADLVVAETVRDTTTVWRLHGSERIELVRVTHAPAWDPAVSISPDGRFVAIAAVTAGTPARIRETALVVVDLETREYRTLDAGVSIHDTPRWIGSERVVYAKTVDADRTEAREAVVRERRGGNAETQAIVEESDVRLVRHHFDTYDRFVLRFADGTEKPLQTRGWLKHAGATSAPLVSSQPVELSLRARAANATCPQGAAYGQQPYPSALFSVFDQAAQNQLGSNGPAIGTMVKGVPPNHSYVPFSVPKSIIRAIGYFETYAVWKQFNASYGSWGYTIISADCGYGIMQITSSMSGGGGFDPARVAAEPTYNIGTGALFLRNKWNGEPAYIGNSDPTIYEDWYYAVWDYNGGSDVNNPSNPKYPNPFPVYNGSNRSQMPYQEAIWSLIRNPYADPWAQYNGAPLWNVVNVTSPSRGLIPYPYGTKKPNIATPQPSHTDGGTQPPACTSFSVNPSTIYASASSGWQSVTITGSPSGCTGGNWSAGGNGSWLSVSPTSGSGSGSVTVSWPQNTSTSPRTGYGSIAGTAIVVDQSGASVPSCTYSFSPASATVGSSTGSSSVQVSGSPAGCNGSWSASSSAGWLWLTGTASGSGSGTWQVPYSYSANAAASSRAATLGVSGSTFTLTQNGATAVQPNLAPYLPSGWTDKVVITKTSGGYMFLDWAVANAGSSSASGFYVDLMVDGALYDYWYVDQLSAGYYTTVEDYYFGPLSWGTHTISLVVDSTGAVAESNESDNVHTRNYVAGPAAIPDLNNDGYPDLVWRHTGNGSNYLWFMSGSTSVGARPLLGVADTNWRIIGLGDFDGDGEPDIAWRHLVTGENYLWYMNGAEQAAATPLPRVSDLNWSAVAVADMNGDGVPDILWRNTATGAVWVWVMNNTAIASVVDLGSVSDQQWRIEGAADMNGDGSTDILWRHYGTGEHYLWLMNGVTRAGTGSVPSVTDTTWEIEALADYDGNGSTDIVWRQYTTGANYMWLMNGMTPSWRGNLSAVNDLQWRIAGPH